MIGNFICGLLVIYFLLYYNIYLVVFFIFIGMFFDFFDGMVVCKLNVVFDMGKELDLFVDLVMFGVVFFMFVYSVLLYVFLFIGILCVLMYSICGMFCFFKFNIE